MTREKIWNMGLQGWSAVTGNLTSVTLTCTLFGVMFWRLMNAHFEQAQFDRALCRQQITALTRAVERHLESSKQDREEMKTILREVQGRVK